MPDGKPNRTTQSRTTAGGADSSVVRKAQTPSVRVDVPSAYAGTLASEGRPGGESLPPGSASLTRFEDQGEVARGGMGAIHRVYDKVLCRTLAMKWMRPSDGGSVGVKGRFVEEAQITGQLDHPNIVPVHDLGLDASEQQAFFIMKLVKGRTLSDVLTDAQEEPLSGDTLQRILEIFSKVCDAVAFAHDRGVVHRDLKPENIMVGDFGQVYVMDWGVALLINGERPSQRTDHDAGEKSDIRAVPSSEYLGRIVGTPSYMAPEQAWGNVGDTDVRTDVYGLGGILYEVLTGRAPHYAETAEQALANSRRGVVPPPTQFAIWPELPPGLCRITMKALQAKQEDRYQTVGELKSDIQQFLLGGGWFQSRRFKAGESIVTEGEEGDHAFIIVSGECEATKTIGGERVVLRRMGPGDVFGETAALTTTGRTASVDALTDVEVTLVTREALHHELQRNPWLEAFVKALAERFRDVDSQLTELRAKLDDGS